MTDIIRPMSHAPRPPKFQPGDTVRLLTDAWSEKARGTLWTVDGSFAQMFPDDIDTSVEPSYSITNEAKTSLSWLDEDELELVQRNHFLRRMWREFLRRLDALDHNPMRVR